MLPESYIIPSSGWTPEEAEKYLNMLKEAAANGTATRIFPVFGVDHAEPGGDCHVEMGYRRCQYGDYKPDVEFGPPLNFEFNTAIPQGINEWMEKQFSKLPTLAMIHLGRVPRKVKKAMKRRNPLHVFNRVIIGQLIPIQREVTMDEDNQYLVTFKFDPAYTKQLTT